LRRTWGEEETLGDTRNQNISKPMQKTRTVDGRNPAPVGRLFIPLPVVPHKAVAEVSKIGNL